MKRIICGNLCRTRETTAHNRCASRVPFDCKDELREQAVCVSFLLFIGVLVSTVFCFRFLVQLSSSYSADWNLRGSTDVLTRETLANVVGFALFLTEQGFGEVKSFSTLSTHFLI